MSKIYLIDDDPFLVSSLTRLLASNGFQVESAGTLKEAWQLLSQSEPDLAVLDLSLPDGDGNDLCRRIRTKWNYPILMLTSRAESIDKVTGLGLGADDYLTKPFDPHELVARVRALLRRSVRTVAENASRVIRVGGLAIDLQARTVHVGEQLIALTQTEFDVLSYLGQNRTRVLHRDQIFQSIWGYGSEFASNSLDVLIYRIRNKLKAVDGNDYIATVRGFGFRLRPSTETDDGGA